MSPHSPFMAEADLEDVPVVELEGYPPPLLRLELSVEKILTLDPSDTCVQEIHIHVKAPEPTVGGSLAVGEGLLDLFQVLGHSPGGRAGRRCRKALVRSVGKAHEQGRELLVEFVRAVVFPEIPGIH